VLDLREVGVDCLTLGQYMQPTRRHLKVQTYCVCVFFASFCDLMTAENGYVLHSWTGLGTYISTVYSILAAIFLVRQVRLTSHSQSVNFMVHSTTS